MRFVLCFWLSGVHTEGHLFDLAQSHTLYFPSPLLLASLSPTCLGYFLGMIILGVDFPSLYSHSILKMPAWTWTLGFIALLGWRVYLLERKLASRTIPVERRFMVSRRADHFPQILMFPQTTITTPDCILVISPLLPFHFLSWYIISRIMVSFCFFFSILTAPRWQRRPILSSTRWEEMTVIFRGVRSMHLNGGLWAGNNSELLLIIAGMLITHPIPTNQLSF